MGLEFLAKFPNSPVCQWFLEEELSKHVNFCDCLARFNNDPQEFESFSPSTGLFIIAAHRDSSLIIEYLFHVATRTGPEFYWAGRLLPSSKPWRHSTNTLARRSAAYRRLRPPISLHFRRHTWPIGSSAASIG
jgi:hypothetical protein